MSTRNLVRNGTVLVAAVSVVAILTSAGPAESLTRGSSVKKLLDKITALEERVSALEAERAMIRPAGGMHRGAHPTYPLPSARSFEPLPPEWIPGDINGIRFYTGPVNRQRSNDSPQTGDLDERDR